MSKLTLRAMPARMTRFRIRARQIPDRAERPPAWMFTTVPMVAPARCNTTEEAGDQIAQTLVDEFLIKVMFGSGDAVSHNGGQQGIDAAQHAQYGGIDQHDSQLRKIEVGDLQAGEPTLRRFHRCGEFHPLRLSRPLHDRSEE